MKTISLTALGSLDFDFKITDIFPEHWGQRKEFSLYAQKARPVSALFFVCSELTVSFFPKGGEPAVTAQKGDIVFIPKGSLYRVTVTGQTDAEIDTYTVNLRFLDEEREEFLLSDRIALLARGQDSRQEISLKRLCDAFHRSAEPPSEGMRDLLKTKGEFFLLMDLIRSSIFQNGEYFYPIRKGAEAFCEEWNKNEKIEKYAQMSEVSVTYFYRCFRKWAGKSPVEYRNMIRLSNAESLLRCTDMRIQEISAAVGFEDPFYFCRMFSERYGSSPKRYRAQYQKE